MAKLENILNSLVEKPGTSLTSKKYSSKTLANALNFSRELREANPKTQEGLKKYQKLTGIDTTQDFPEESQLMYQKIIGGTQDLLTSYVDKHMRSIASEIPDSKLTKIAYQFLPDTENTSEKYKTTRGEIEKHMERIKKIREDPKRYLKQQIAEAPEYLRGIIARMPEETLQVDATSSQKKANMAISKYGVADFVSDSYDAQKKIEIRLNKKIKEVKKERSTLAEKMPENLNTLDTAKYFAKVDEKLKKSEKELAEVQMLDEMRNTILSIAMQEIAQAA